MNHELLSAYSSPERQLSEPPRNARRVFPAFFSYLSFIIIIIIIIIIVVIALCARRRMLLTIRLSSLIANAFYRCPPEAVYGMEKGPVLMLSPSQLILSNTHRLGLKKHEYPLLTSHLGQCVCKEMTELTSCSFELGLIIIIIITIV